MILSRAKIVSWLCWPLILALWVGSLENFVHGQALGQAVGQDEIDANRTRIYIEQLESKQAARRKLQKRAEAISQFIPSVQRDIYDAMQLALISEATLQNTPALEVFPQLGYIYGSRNGPIDDRLTNNPGYYLWYTLQDNTLYRQQLFLQLNAAQQNSQQGLVTLRSNRIAIQQIAQEADENFSEFYRLADLLGRRSSNELQTARRLSQTWLEEDPKHAGAMLIHAYCLRSEGRFDECQKWLEQLDRNYPTMNAIRKTVQAQIAFIQDDPEQADKFLDQAAIVGKKIGLPEPYLVRGWLAMADQKWSRAKQDASIAHQLAPGQLETSILLALATIADRPRAARDALQILREAQLRISPADWHYQEALGLAHAAAGDKAHAVKSFDTAIANAPSFVRNMLTIERDEAAKGNSPVVQWKTRIIAQWKNSP